MVPTAVEWFERNHRTADRGKKGQGSSGKVYKKLLFQSLTRNENREEFIDMTFDI